MEQVAFPLIGEPVALDLLNSRPNTADGPVDLIATPEGLQAWLELQAGRLPSAHTPVATREVEAVLTIRDHMASAIERARRSEPPPKPALEALMDAQRAAPPWRLLTWDGQQITASLRRHGTPGDQLVADLADAAIDLLAGPKITAVRACDSPHCTLLFLPAHPRRQWCSPALCGNRARVARYYRRHKQT